MRVWPRRFDAGDGRDHDASVAPGDTDEAAGIEAAACLPWQNLQLEACAEGWKLIVSSPVEAGRVEVLIPRERQSAVQVVADTRNASVPVGSKVLLARGQYQQAAFVAARELQGVRERSPADTAALVAALARSAEASLRTGDAQRAESLLDEALTLCESAPVSDAARLIRLLHDRAYVRYVYRCTDEEAALDVRHELEAVRARAEKLLGGDHPETARILTSQARLLLSDFAYHTAEELLNAAIRIRTAALGAEHPDVAESLLELARLYAYRDDMNDADATFRRVLAIREAHFGPCHPELAEALIHYSDFLIYNRKDSVAAEAQLRRAMRIWDDTLGRDHPLVAREAGFIRKVLSGQG